MVLPFSRIRKPLSPSGSGPRRTSAPRPRAISNTGTGGSVIPADCSTSRAALTARRLGIGFPLGIFEESADGGSLFRVELVANFFRQEARSLVRSRTWQEFERRD